MAGRDTVRLEGEGEQDSHMEVEVLPLGGSCSMVFLDAVVGSWVVPFL